MPRTNTAVCLRPLHTLTLTLSAVDESRPKRIEDIDLYFAYFFIRPNDNEWFRVSVARFEIDFRCGLGPNTLEFPFMCSHLIHFTQ